MYVPNGQGFPHDIRKGEHQPEDSNTDSSEDNGSHSAARPENPLENGDQPLLWKDSVSVSSRSSSSDSCVHLFQVDPTQHHRQQPANEEPADLASPSQEPEAFNPRQTPAIQVMDRSEAYDPSRIPASVFTPKSSSPMDWSVASNESLFSLQVGNNSFNRDQFLTMGVDLRKSGELFKPHELYKSDMLKSGELFSLSPSTPVENRESAHLDTPKAANNSTKTPHREDQPPSLPVSTSTISSHSDGSGVSGASARSFAFPVLAEAKRDSTEKEESVNLPQKQVSKTSLRKSLSAQFSSKIPSCSLCCCYCSCSCLSWRPRCPQCRRLCCCEPLT